MALNYYIKCLIVLIMKLFIVYTISSPGKIQHCPGTCSCKHITKGVKVTCSSTYWNTIPRLPDNTTIFVLKGSDMNILRNNTMKKNYTTHLSALNLPRCQINEIQMDAFNGLQVLRSLLLTHNNISSFLKGTFLHIPFVTGIYLDYNSLSTIPSELCEIRQLKSVRIGFNPIVSVEFDHCFQNMTKLTSIDLSGLPLKVLTGDTFKYLNHLKVLTLFRCQITEISPNFPRNVPQLTTLSVYRNKIREIHCDVLSQMTELRLLVLFDNPIKSLNTTCLQYLSHLRELNIGQLRVNALSTDMKPIDIPALTILRAVQNHLYRLNSQSFTWIRNNSLQEVYLDESRISFIENDTFDSLSELRILKLNRNPINVSVLKGALEGLNSKPLQILYLDNLHLHGINADTFFGLQNNNITKLSLKQSNISALPSGCFDVFTKLRYLYLDGNRINAIGSQLFLYLNHLRELRLSHSQISNIPKATELHFSESLNLIDLSENDFRNRLTIESFRGFEHIETLNLRDCSISAINMDAFTFLPNVRTIHLSGNTLRTISTSLFQPTRKLQHLDLGSNKLSYISDRCFQNAYNLNSLVLSNNNELRGNIPSTIFRNLSSLRKLEMALCNIFKLHNDLFLDLVNLEELNLGSNEIVTWDPEVFIPLSSLTSLNLGNNRILTVNSTSFVHLTSLTSIQLGGNLFVCTCEIVWFLDWIINGDIFVDIKGKHDKRYFCASPSIEKDKSLLNVGISLSACQSLAGVIATAAVCSSVLVVVILSTTVYRYRWYLRYWLFLLKARHRHFRELINDEQYIYDAFICYNSEDRTWVIENLLPELEYQGGLQLCLHDRDWLAGPDIVDNILESIENSRRTILVLTNHFARSQWCQFEMTMAQHKLTDDNRDILVLVVLEDIKQEFMSTRMRCLLSTKTYLAWSDDPREQKKFWDGLRKTLRRQPRFNYNLQAVE